MKTETKTINYAKILFNSFDEKSRQLPHFFEKCIIESHRIISGKAEVTGNDYEDVVDYAKTVVMANGQVDVYGNAFTYEGAIIEAYRMLYEVKYDS